MLLVTGITGHTGRYFLQELVVNKYPHPIRCIVRKTSDLSILKGSGLNIEIVEGDLNDPLLMDKVMKGITKVVHIYNIHHSPDIVQAAIKHKVKRVILVHTTGIYSKYKYASEGYKLVENKITALLENQPQLNITILRPTMIYGDLCDRNISRFIKLIDKFRLVPVINKGTSLLQPVNARDLGKALYQIIDLPQTFNKSYNLSGEKPIAIIDIYKLISDLLGKKTLYLNVPLNVATLAAEVIKIFTLGKVNIVEKVQRMGEDRSYSHQEAMKDFYYQPMSFEEGLRMEVTQYLDMRN